MSSEDQLLQRLKKRPRDAQAWAELYDAVQPGLKLFVYSLARTNAHLSVDDADDIVHEILTRLVQDFHRHTAGIETFQHLKNYLFRSCRNEVASRSRHGAVHDSARVFLQLRFSDVTLQGPDSTLHEVENRETVAEILAVLDEKCRALVWYYMSDQGTLAKYAEINNLPAGTGYSQWSRCLAFLRKTLQPHARNPPAGA